MKLTAKVKLQPTPEQHQFLLQTLETTNAACNEISVEKTDAYDQDTNLNPFAWE